jgi:uncharacterized protein (DUF2267 family)
MRYDEFLSKVAERATGGDRDKAADLTRASLQTLAERISGGEADDLASQLPQELKDWLTARQERPEDFDIDEFTKRVWQRARLPSQEDAERGVVAVFATLREAVTRGEFDDVLSQLPDQYRRLIPSPAA